MRFRNRKIGNIPCIIIRRPDSTPDAMRYRQSAIVNRRDTIYAHCHAPSFRCDAISLSAVGGMLSVCLYNTYSPDAMRYRYGRSAFQNCQHKDLKCSRLRYSTDFEKAVKWRDIMIHSYLKFDLLNNPSPALNCQNIHSTLKRFIQPNNGVMSI